MSIAELIRKMAQAGAPPEAIALAVEAIEAKEADMQKRRDTERDRARRYRERGGGNISADLRASVMERDGGVCQECGSLDYPQIDHIHPVSLGGATEEENLQVLCRVCNARKKDRVRKSEKRNSAEFPRTSSDIPTPDKERSPTPPKEINPTPSSLRSDNKRGTRLPPDFQPNLVFAVELGFDRSQALAEFDKFRDYWAAKAGKDATKLDWPATWRNWLRNAAKPRNRPHQQAPPRETEHARHQREFRESIQQKLNGNPGHDEFASTGPTFDLEPGDYNAHRAPGAGSR